MSIQEMAWAWQLTGVSPVAKLAALYLGDIHRTIPASMISVAKVAAFCGVEETDIVDAFDELKGVGVQIDEDENDNLSTTFPIAAGVNAAPANERAQCSIYVIAAETRTKIGISRNIKSRMKDLQAWAPETLVLAFALVGPTDLIRKAEAVAHASLSSERIVGEWFSVPSSVAVDAVRAALADQGISS
jgi:hypothetical protein